MLFRTARLSRTTSCPAMRALPRVGRSSVARMWTVVVLPAPFGPRKPKNSASPTSRSRPSSARTAPKSLPRDRKSTRLNSSHGYISYAVFCLKKKKDQERGSQPNNQIYTRSMQEIHLTPAPHASNARLSHATGRTAGPHDLTTTLSPLVSDHG